MQCAAVGCANRTGRNSSVIDGGVSNRSGSRVSTIKVYWRRMFGGLLHDLAVGVLISKEGSDKDESIHGKEQYVRLR